MYVRVYIHVYVYLYVDVYVCIYMYMYVCTCMLIHSCVCKVLHDTLQYILAYLLWMCTHNRCLLDVLYVTFAKEPPLVSCSNTERDHLLLCSRTNCMVLNATCIIATYAVFVVHAVIVSYVVIVMSAVVVVHAVVTIWQSERCACAEIDVSPAQRRA